MQLPKQLEALRDKRVWICYPMIWNDKKHGVGGYDKPPINPYTLYNGSSDEPESLATYDKAIAQIGKTAHVRVKGHNGLITCKVVGAGIALSGTGICGLDLDNVVDRERRVMTREAGEIVALLDSYTEISPSGSGLHIVFLGKLPENIKKIVKPKPDIFKTELAEYQLLDSGYITISGDVIGDHELSERTEQVAQMYEQYFREVEPIAAPSTKRPSTKRPSSSSSVVSSGFTYERWLYDVGRLSDAEILEGIFLSDSVGKKVKRLYEGDTSDYNNDHSRADQALVTYLYGFTNDRAIAERLFRSSALYRESGRSTGKSRNYLERTLNKAEKNCVRLIGHIEFTDEEKRAYAKKKEEEERKSRKYGEFIRARAKKKRGE